MALMDYPDLKLLGKYNHPKDRKNPELVDYKLQVFSYNNDDGICQRICSALSCMRFAVQILLTQFWAAIDFKSASVLTTRGQPFAHTSYTNEFWSYHIRCLDHNSHVNHKTNICIGLPARVFLNRYPECTQDVSRYTDILYPQLEDALHSNIRGSLAMPVIDRDKCIGALELVMTNMNDICFHEMMSEVCRALEEVDLKSFVQNENINCAISKDYSSIAESSGTKIRSRISKSCDVTCNDITKLFGMPKADAAKICGISENTLTKVHRRFGIDEWPCVRKGVVKSSAHNALELGRAYLTTSGETQKIKDINFLMQEDDDINFEMI